MTATVLLKSYFNSLLGRGRSPAEQMGQIFPVRSSFTGRCAQSFVWFSLEHEVSNCIYKFLTKESLEQSEGTEDKLSGK